MIDPLDDPTVEAQLHYAFTDHSRGLAKVTGHLDELIDQIKRDYRHVNLPDWASLILHNLTAARELLVEANDTVHEYLALDVGEPRTIRKLLNAVDHEGLRVARGDDDTDH